jgi:hypothetical protein
LARLGLPRSIVTPVRNLRQRVKENVRSQSHERQVVADMMAALRPGDTQTESRELTAVRRPAYHRWRRVLST